MSRHQQLTLFLVFILITSLMTVHFTAPPNVATERSFAVLTIFMFIGWTTFNHYTEMRQRRGAWDDAAEALNLSYREGNLIMGYLLTLNGEFEGRRVQLSAPKQNQRVFITKMQMQMDNRHGASLRFRGPFKPDEIRYDHGVQSLFRASQSEMFGHEQMFFIRSHPPHLRSAMLRAQGSMRQRLEGLAEPCTIELVDHTLYFEQVGLLDETAEIVQRFQLLSELADLVETEHAVNQSLTRA